MYALYISKYLYLKKKKKSFTIYIRNLYCLNNIIFFLKYPL